MFRSTKNLIFNFSISRTYRMIAIRYSKLNNRSCVLREEMHLFITIRNYHFSYNFHILYFKN